MEDKARMKAGEGTRDWITLRFAIALDSFFGYNFNATFLVLFLMFFSSVWLNCLLLVLEANGSAELQLAARVLPAANRPALARNGRFELKNV